MLTRHVIHFLDFFAGGPGQSALNTFCWMDGENSAPVSGRGCVHGTLKNIARWEKELDREGISVPELHITLNETDLSGRRTENIKAYRVLCCDLDRKVSEEEILQIYEEYAVQMVIRSSREKYHLYWSLERGGDLALWQQLQLGIAQKLSGDLQVSLPTSMIRVPGFSRVTKSGKKELASVMAFAKENPVTSLSIKNIVRMWPWIWEEGEKGARVLKKQRKKTAKVAWELIRSRGKKYDELKFARMTPNVGRNTVLYLTVSEAIYQCEEKLSLEDAFSFGEEINSAFPEPLGEIETKNTIRSAWKKGIRARKKKIREKNALIHKLQESPEEEALVNGVLREGIPEEEPHKVSTQDLRKVLVDAVVGKEEFVADTFLDISGFIVGILWKRKGISKEERTRNQNILASAYKTKYYKRLTDFIIDALKHTGSFSVSGYGAFLRGENESGDLIKYRNSLSFEARSALLQDIFSKLYLEMVRASLRRQSKKENKRPKEGEAKNGPEGEKASNLEYLKENA